MQVDFSRNFFELFELPVQFELERDVLTQRYRQWQRVLHPDRFASGTETERRWSVQAASFVNEGYQSLQDPLRRASYMLSMNGIDLNEETDTQMDPMFLMQQLEWRESLEAVNDASDPAQAVKALEEELNQATEEHIAAFSQASRAAVDSTRGERLGLTSGGHERIGSVPKNEQQGEQVAVHPAELGAESGADPMANLGAAHWAEARKIVRQWQFLDKMRREARQSASRADA